MGGEKNPTLLMKHLFLLAIRKKIVTSFKIISISPTFLQTFGWAIPQNFALVVGWRDLEMFPIIMLS